MAGEELLAVDSESRAKEIVTRRERVLELKNQIQKSADMDTTLDASGQQCITLSVILKADGVGTLGALEKLIKSVTSRISEVIINIVGTSVGDVNENDVRTASNVGNVIILGFNIGIADSNTRSAANQADIKIVRDTVIYRLEDELINKIESLMPKEKKVIEEGTALVKKIFTFNNKANTTVAGLVVQSGTLKTGSQYVFNILRNGEVKHHDAVALELRRFKDVVHQVEKGLECGLTFEKLKDFEEGDEIVCQSFEWNTKKLKIEPSLSANIHSNNYSSNQTSSR